MTSSPTFKRALPFNDQEIKQENFVKKIKEEYPITEEALEVNGDYREIKQEDFSKKIKEENYPITEKMAGTDAQSSTVKALNKSDNDFEFEDDSLNRKCLISCFPFLSDNLIIEEVIIYLRANNILTQHQADLIHAKKTQLDKTEILINIVQQRGPKAFNCIMKSLTETGQKKIFDKLITERKTIAERENLRKSAEQGNADAQFNLGNMYRNGKGVAQSGEEALKWFRKSAEQGHAGSQNNLGLLYLNGQFVPQSDKEALKWFRKSTELGDAGGQNNLGFMYRNGRSVPQSDEEAVKWYTKSAEKGYAIAQYNLGWIYRNGRGVPQSDEQAFKWYRKAAEQGNAAGQNNLGSMYEYGKGVTQSSEDAVKWYRKSAEQGDDIAQCNLGIMYEYGKGVIQSDEEAAKWYTKSAKQGYANAQSKLLKMSNKRRGTPN